MYRKTFVTLVLVLSFSAWCFAEEPKQPSPGKSPKKIVFIAGPQDHGGPITHAYEKDLLLLKKCIDESPDLKGVTTKIYLGKAPKDINELRDAATIVVHSSGDVIAKETHALFPIHNKFSEADAKYLKELDALMKRGLGIVVLHYSLIVRNPRSRAYLLDWIGGYHREGKSQVKIDTSKAVPATPGHPILNGVGPWTTRHEYYYNEQFGKDDKRMVPILTSMLPSSKPQKHVIAWAVQREGGGRGFAFTGCHFYKNMLLEDYRRMLLNAVLWTANIPVPKKGLTVPITEKDLKLPPERGAKPAARIPEADTSSNEWKRRLAGSKFRQHKDLAQNKTGRIMQQKP